MAMAMAMDLTNTGQLTTPQSLAVVAYADVSERRIPDLTTHEKKKHDIRRTKLLLQAKIANLSSCHLFLPFWGLRMFVVNFPLGGVFAPYLIPKRRKVQ